MLKVGDVVTVIAAEREYWFGMALHAHLETPEQVVDYLARRFLAVPLQEDVRHRLAEFLTAELGTANIQAAATYLEEPLRMLLHVMLSLPEYQLG